MSFFIISALLLKEAFSRSVDLKAFEFHNAITLCSSTLLCFAVFRGIFRQEAVNFSDFILMHQTLQANVKPHQEELLWCDNMPLQKGKRTRTHITMHCLPNGKFLFIFHTEYFAQCYKVEGFCHFPNKIITYVRRKSRKSYVNYGERF